MEGTVMIHFTVKNVAETEQLAERLAQLLKPKDVLTLEGDLGAGKTTFTKALAKGLGIKRTVSSPTFTIMKQYEGNYPLNHLDVYRLEGSEEDLGWDEIFYGDAITVVEWAHYIEDVLPEEHLELRIQRESEDVRTIELLPKGQRYENICKELQL